MKRACAGQFGSWAILRLVGLCALLAVPAAHAQRGGGRDRSRPPARPKPTDRRPPKRPGNDHPPRPGSEHIQRPSDRTRQAGRDRARLIARGRGGQIDRSAPPPTDHVLGFDMFRPQPEDFGPLRPGEDQEIQGFVRSRMPRVFRFLQQARQRNPQAVQARLREMLPRLRSLKRLADEDPRLGQRLIRYTENTLSMEMARRLWDARPSERGRIRQNLRKWVAENYRLELGALGDRLNALESSQDQRIDELIDLLTAPDANLDAEPAELREAVRNYQAATSPAERQQRMAQLRSICRKRLTQEIATRRERLAGMQRDASKNIERRYREMIHRLESNPDRFAAPQQPPRDRP